VTLVVLSPTDRAPTPGPIATPYPELPRNYAAGQPVTASSSDADGWGPQRLVDGVTHSLPNTWGWSTQNFDSPDTEAWVQVDLGEPTLVDTVRLYPRDDWGNEGAGFPVDFVLQGATDPDEWTTLVGVTNHQPQNHPREMRRFTFEPGEYRYIRLLATQLRTIGEDEYGLQLAEMEVLRERGD
jgi:hypothetical protein